MIKNMLRCSINFAFLILHCIITPITRLRPPRVNINREFKVYRNHRFHACRGEAIAKQGITQI